MPIHKTMSERALLANRNNGKKSKGPNNADRTRSNATTHGLLTRDLKFDTEADKNSFDASVQELAAYHRSVGPTEWSLILIMAVCLWKLGQLFGLESAELKSRTSNSQSLIQGLQCSLISQGLHYSSALEQGWEAQELTIHAGGRDKTKSGYSSHDKTENAIVDVKLTTRLDTILRYRTTIQRDFYRALATLQELQRERLEIEQLVPMSEEVVDEKP